MPPVKSSTMGVLAALFLCGRMHAEPPIGKQPSWDGWAVVTSSADSTHPLTPIEDTSITAPSTTVTRVLKPLTTLANAAEFIHAQRGLDGEGLPATFYIPPGVRIENPLRHLIVSEGVGLYDTSLAILVLLEANKFREARSLVDIYAGGIYDATSRSPMELRAFPSRDNDQAFEPFDEDTFYFFDFTNVYGNWLRWENNGLSGPCIRVRTLGF